MKILKKEPFHAQNDRKQPAAKPFPGVPHRLSTSAPSIIGMGTGSIPKELLHTPCKKRRNGITINRQDSLRIIPTAPSFPMKTIHQKKESKQLPQKKPSMKAKDILFFRIFATQL
ncbi:MAG: hypothetical protein ACOCOR_01190 [Prevotella sp.]